MMRDKSEIVIDIARQFFAYINENTINWDEAFLRYEGNDSYTGCTCTYSNESEAFYVQPNDRQLKFEVMSELNKKFEELQSQLQFQIALLVIRANMDFKIKYQQSPSNAWSISKLDGQTGFPQGYNKSEWW